MSDKMKKKVLIASLVVLAIGAGSLILLNNENEDVAVSAESNSQTEENVIFVGADLIDPTTSIEGEPDKEAKMQKRRVRLRTPNSSLLHFLR